MKRRRFVQDNDIPLTIREAAVDRAEEQMRSALGLDRRVEPPPQWLPSTDQDGGISRYRGQLLPPPAKPRKTTAKVRGKVSVKDRDQVLLYSRIVIATVEEALDYEPRRSHNGAMPVLYVDDKDFLDAIRKLSVELKRLNDFLGKKSIAQKKSDTSVLSTANHLHTFLDLYAKALARPAAWATVALLVNILHQAGLDGPLFRLILQQIETLSSHH